MKTDNQKYKTGVIHGRFQILHNDHLKYLMAGKGLCRHLVVGITNPDPSLTREDDADLKRSSRLANPLTYYERYCMIRSVMEDAGLNFNEFSIVPLPINLPDMFRYYVPMDAVFFLAIYDDWGKKKLKMFQSLGVRTHILRETALNRKGISASDIRRHIIDNEPWEEMVPPTVAALVKDWNITKRLKELSQ